MQRPFLSAPHLVAGLCLTALYVFGARQDDHQEALARRAEALASDTIRERGAAGVSIVIELGGRTLLAEGYGYAGWEPDVRASAETSYRIAPLLEHVLAVAVLRLVQDGVLALDDPLEKLLPELREKPWPGVRLRHILAQTSGIPSYARLLGRREFEAFPEQDVLAWLAEVELDDEPGTCYEASPSNLLLLGLILEAKTERGVQDWTQEQLFGLLGLEATHWCWTGRGPRPRGALPLPFGAEGLCSSAADLARWVRGLAEGTLLDARRFEFLTTPTLLADGTSTGHGMGMASGRLEGLRRFALGSSFADSHVLVGYYPDRDLTLVAAASGDRIALGPLEQSLTRAALGLPEPGIQDLALTPEEQERFVGGYYVGCNRLGIVSAGRRLRLETAESPWSILLYQGEQRFVARDDPGLSLTFQFEGERAIAFVLERHGNQTVARRID